MKTGFSKQYSMGHQFRRHYLFVSLIPLLFLLVLVITGTMYSRQYVSDLILSSNSELNKDAEKHLQQLGEKIIKQKARDVAKQLDLYFQMHPGKSITQMRDDPKFMKLAIQQVGKTGYTALTETKTYLFRVHPNSKLNDTDFRRLATLLPDWWLIIEKAIDGDETTGYYNWKDPDGKIKKKFLATTPVPTPVKGITMMLSASTYIDEFSEPVIDMRTRANAIITNYQEYINRQWFIIAIITSAVIFTTYSWTYFMGRKIARRYITPIMHLSDLTLQISKGNWESSSEKEVLERKDEIGILANTLDRMSKQLKNLISSLEQKIKELNKTKEALVVSEERHRMISGLSTDYVYLAGIVKDGYPVLEWVSGAYTELTGYTIEEINTMPDTMMSIIHPDDLELIRNRLVKENRLQTDKPTKIEYRIFRKDNQVRWLSDRIQPLFDENRQLVSILGASSDITERKNAEEELKHSLHEKEILLKELYHRTKNNMQVINAMLALQAESIDDEKVKTIFKETENRIHSMALVHKKLYESKNLSMINLKDYITDLSNDLLHNYWVSDRDIQIEFDLDTIDVLIDIAIPCGLIVNELLSNIFKHAFNDRNSGIIAVSCHRIENGMINLRISDNGQGFPDGFSPRESDHFGLLMVFGIVEVQLDGTIEYSTDQGITWVITFKDELYKKRV